MPGATARPHSSLTYSPRAGPVSARLVFQSSRWLRHQHTEDPGFLGPSMVATSPNRAVVAGWTSMLTGPRLLSPSGSAPRAVRRGRGCRRRNRRP